MAKNAKTAAPPPPPLPTTAHHATVLHNVEIVQPAVVPIVQDGGEHYEAHPMGTAQYIAELETEAAQHIAELEAIKGRVTEGFKHIASTAITHAAQMAGHLPLDINAIPGIDAINKASAAPE